MTSLVPTVPALSRSAHRRPRPMSVSTVALIAVAMIIGSTTFALWTIFAVP